jgi:isopenicillin-N epimerase
MEAEPVRFLVRQMQPLWDSSRQALADLIGCRSENLVPVASATAAVNAVLRSLRFRQGDELLVTNHGYNACNNVARYVAEREGATLVTVEVPVPVESSAQIVDAVLARVTEHTRLAMLDHITSATGFIFPIEELIRRLGERGVDTLVDGAHAPGMAPLRLEQLGAAYYAGNCHKWLCCPKGAGFLYARPDRQEGLQPPVISHGYNRPRPGYTPFQDAFDWQGTADPSPWLCVGEAIRFLAGLLPGGMSALMDRNRALALAGRRLLCERLSLLPVCPEEMLGSMAALLLPDDIRLLQPEPGTFPPLPRLGRVLLEEYGIEVPVHYWQDSSRAILRISAQAYNHLRQYSRLAEVLAAL